MPAASVPISLPWTTGRPASFHWRVRAFNGRAASAWSAPASFTMGWDKESLDKGVPQRDDSEPGFVRWNKVAGAVGYQVWFTNAKERRIVSTITNVADIREYYGKHEPGSRVLWRVRALRRVLGAAQNGLPALLYGTWSGPEPYASYVPAGPRTRSARRVSDAISWGTLTQRRISSCPPSSSRRQTASDCTACMWQPTKTASMSSTSVLPFAVTRMRRARQVETRRVSRCRTRRRPCRASLFWPARSAARVPPAHHLFRPTFLQNRAAIDLWDNDWPGGRYYWTVVPVGADGDDRTSSACVPGRPSWRIQEDQRSAGSR